MKKITSIAICASALASIASAEVAGTFSTGYNSHYIYRGVDLGGGLEMLDFGLDFTGDCGCGFTWNSGLWYASTDSAAANDELDFYGSVGKDFGFGNVTLGYIRYTYPQNGRGLAKKGHDGEVFLGLGADYAGLNLGATAYFGEEGVLDNGTWLDLTAGYSTDVTDALSLSLDLGLGFAFGNYSTRGFGGVTQTNTGFSDLNDLATMTATLGADYALTDDMNLSAYVTNVQSTEDFSQGTDITYWGVSASYSF